MSRAAAVFLSLLVSAASIPFPVYPEAVAPASAERVVPKPRPANPAKKRARKAQKAARRRQR